ncbi:signal peptidase I [Luminiphilus sp.]|nr:signal peptidase I [Luminiphilus sp.]
MNIDLPLILTIIVGLSGAIWLLDALFFARQRSERLSRLQRQHPNWSNQGSADEKLFTEAAIREASEPLVVEYAKSFFPVLAFVLVLRSFLYEPFQIPSSSMVPTLQVGDYILVNKFNYGLRLPVTRTKVWSMGSPDRGDVMVFYPPHANKQYYIKRVIGIPGDRIHYRNKRLSVNGVDVPREWLAEIPGTRRIQVGLEEPRSERSHLFQVDQMRPTRDFSIVVRPGHYFMMGDNRDNSSDSRVWGQVPERDIVGEAVAIWMHWESLFSIPSFDRAGALH